MQGLSGTYAFNNIDFLLQPSEGKWLERSEYGIDGSGHPIYTNLRNFELSWDLISTTDAAQLINQFNAVGNTGSVISCLPEWGNIEYSFKNYSGTTLRDPVVGEYFQGYISSVKLLILNVRTN